MKTKIICKKALTFILVFALVAVQMFSSSVFTQANTTEAGTLFATTDILTDDEWEEVYYKADTLEIRSNGNSTLFTGLEENSTYMLDFDMTVVDASSLLLVGLRSDASFTAGQYLQLGNIGVTQARVSSDYWSGSLYGSNSISDFAVGDVVAVKVLMNPTSVALYLNGTLVQLYDHVNNDGYKDSVAVSSVANGSLLFGHNGGGTGIDVSNISLKKQLPQWETVFSREEKLEIRSNGNSTLFTGLNENATYMLKFDMTVIDASSLLLVGLRSDASFTAGQYLQLGNIGVTQARVSSDYWSGSLYGSNSISDFAVGDVVAVKVLMNPTSVALYLNGTLVQLYDHVNNDGYKDSVAVSSVANGSLLFGHNGGGTGIDVSNIVLKKEPTEEGETPEDPDTPVEDTTEWSENILTNQEDLSLTDYSKKLLDVTLDKDTAYQLEFDMKVNSLSTTNLAVILRESADGSTGIYSDYWFSMNQIRTGAAIDGNGWPNLANDTLVNGTVTFAEGTTYSVKYIIEPEKVYMYIDDNLISVTLGTSGGYTQSDYTTVSKIANAKIGFIAQNSAPNVDISNIILKKDLAVNINQDEIDSVEALIDAIGTVTVDSKTAIATARSAYEELSAEEKPLVENYAVLTAAEAAYAELIASKDINAYALDSSYAMGGNFWGSAITVSNTVGGGMHFEFNNDGVDMRQGVNKGVALDGLHAVFKGLNFTSSAKSIAFYLADKNVENGYSSVFDYPLVLVLNTNAGTLSVIDAANNNAETVIIPANDNLKYANIADIEWSMKMAKNEDGSYTINVAGAEGTITADMLNCISLTQTEEVYFTICAWDWAATTVGGFDFVSLHDGKNACVDDLSEEDFQEVLSVIEAIDAIGYVTKEDTDAVNAAMLAYVSLSDVQKSCVTNYDILLNAMNQLSSLVSGLCNKYHGISADDFAGINHWTSNLITSDVEGGGANIKWIHAGKNFRQAINRKLSLDGLHMIFSGLEIAEDSQSKTMAIFFANEITSYDAYYSEWVDGQNTVLALVFDFEAGTVYANVGDQSQLIIANANLNYDSLKNAMWDLKINKSGSNYTVSVRNITGTLSGSLVSSASHISNTNDVRATFSPWGYCSISLNINSVHGNDRTCAESLSEAELGTIDAVIDGINAVYNENNQITADAQAKYNTVIGQYNALSSNYQTMVYNYDKLTLAQQVLAVVNTIEGLTDISLSSEGAIDAARNAYKALSIDGRKAVGNYSILNEAVRTLQRLKKEAALAGTDIFLKG